MQLTGEGVEALLRWFVGIGVPPVTDGDRRVAVGNGEGLPDTIITAHVAAKIDAVLPGIRFDSLNKFVPFCR